MQTLQGGFPPPSAHNPWLGKRLDPIVMRGLKHDPDQRWPTAREMAIALEEALTPATASRVGAWALQIAADAIGKRDRVVAEVESISQRVACPRLLPPAEQEGERDSAGWACAPAGAHSEKRLHTAPDLADVDAPSIDGELVLPDELGAGRGAMVLSSPPQPTPRRRAVPAAWILGLSALVVVGLVVAAVARTAAEREPRTSVVATAVTPATAIVAAPPSAVAVPTAAPDIAEAPEPAARPMRPARARPAARKAEPAAQPASTSEWSGLTRH
jgi:serine/threonine-protein kinase